MKRRKRTVNREINLKLIGKSLNNKNRKLTRIRRKPKKRIKLLKKKLRRLSRN